MRSRIAYDVSTKERNQGKTGEKMKNRAIQYGTASLVWITATAIVTSVHHVFRLGWELVIPFAILVALPLLLMWWYRQKASKFALTLYTLVGALVFVWFGFIDGFMDHVIKALGLPNTTFLPGGEEEVVKTVLTLWSPESGDAFYEGTGIITALLSFVALYFLIRFNVSALSSSKSPLDDSEKQDSLV